MTDSGPDFPRKLLLFYNKGLPDNEEGLGKSSVDQLRGYVEDYYERNYQKQNRFRALLRFRVSQSFALLGYFTYRAADLVTFPYM